MSVPSNGPLMHPESGQKTKWRAVNSPMNEELNEETIKWMEHKVNCLLTGDADPIEPAVFMLEKEKEFKFGKGKEIIAFADGGKNKFGKEIKYVKFFYLYENKSTVKPNPKTYTFGVAKSRDFWNDKITEGYNRIDDKTT